VNDVEQLSDFSVSASATPGIKAEVVTPLNLRASRKENGILLIWDDLSKAEPNLLGYKIYRKEINEKNFTLLPGDTLTRSKNYYSDSTALRGRAYMVSAIDFYVMKAQKVCPPNTYQGTINITRQQSSTNTRRHPFGDRLQIKTFQPINISIPKKEMLYL
jgi:hypothetical protein